MATPPPITEGPIPEPQTQQQQEQGVKEFLHKTKTVQFLGRTTPIVLQNDNGPCPLLSICNILLLRNNLNLSSDIVEVSQEKLLSLVAERLIDSNSNVYDKDTGYVENQQQNISDAIDLLPHLATGIDVNTRFRKIDDFEFTPECAIFDLLDIPLYHGWIVDPQDSETLNAIGPKSYNALMGELVTLETKNVDTKHHHNTEEDSIDFAAATTATLGVPSPSISKVGSFDDSPCSISPRKNPRKGDLDEEAELLRVLQISKIRTPALDVESASSNVTEGPLFISSEASSCSKEVMPVNSVDSPNNNSNSVDQIVSQLELISDTHTISVDSIPGASEVCVPSNDVAQSRVSESQVDIESTGSSFQGNDNMHVDESLTDIIEGDTSINKASATTDALEARGLSGTEIVEASTRKANSDTPNDCTLCTDVSETIASNISDSEPIYEGEECIADSDAKVYEVGEPMYEGEGVLAEQADESTSAASNAMSDDEITPKQGELIKNFLKNNASQLTFYGLFCLQDGLKERELCVFFRNNHFSTMFKYEGELYLLATDQGYINQPDLVWEKLNEVNGDTLFMTGNFREFKVDDHGSDTWNEQNAVANTAEYISNVDSVVQAGLDISSDLQLAIALQQQEFDSQPQRHNLQQQSNTSNSRLIVGPQVERNSGKSSSSSTKTDTKSKEKCIVM